MNELGRSGPELQHHLCALPDDEVRPSDIDSELSGRAVEHPFHQTRVVVRGHAEAGPFLL